MSESERKRIALACFAHFGLVTADFLRSDLRERDEIENSVTIEGRENFHAAESKGKGILFVCAHFGNWERMAAILASMGKPLVVIQRNANDAGVNREMTRLREASGVTVLSRGNAARAALESLKKQMAVALMPDQNAGDAFVPLFGHPAGTVRGPAVLHLRTGAPLLPVYCARIGPNQYRITIEPELIPDPNYADPAEGLIAAVHASLERTVRRHPEQWLWLHDRWKSARQRGLVNQP
jgi:KDO2-lipid IV(A) lauroyltransferase